MVNRFVSVRRPGPGRTAAGTVTRPADGTGAYLILDTEDLDSAEAVMQSLPMAQVGMLDFAYIELAPPA